MAEFGSDLCGLVGDIGGTNARFAIARFTGGSLQLDHVLTLPAARYPTIEAAAQDYLARIPPTRLEAAVAACAGPVMDGAVSFTNLAWATTELAFGGAIGLPSVHLINDLAAVAWATPLLPADGVRAVAHLPQPPQMGVPAGAAAAEMGRATRGILNAGTGCNASALVQNHRGEAVVVVGEYGHAGFAPTDALEMEIWRHLQARFGRVSIERVLSGPGLLNLYNALAAIEGVLARASLPAEISQAAAAGEALAVRTVGRFCAILGSVAGDVALCLGARGGLYLAGGVAAMLLTAEHHAVFRRRFEDKGRFEAYLAGIPTLVIHDGNVALLGAARAMAAQCQHAGPAQAGAGHAGTKHAGAGYTGAMSPPHVAC